MCCEILATAVLFSSWALFELQLSVHPPGSSSALKRKPKTLEEAVEKAVRLRCVAASSLHSRRSVPGSAPTRAIPADSFKPRGCIFGGIGPSSAVTC